MNLHFKYALILLVFSFCSTPTTNNTNLLEQYDNIHSQLKSSKLSLSDIQFRDSLEKELVTLRLGDTFDHLYFRGLVHFVLKNTDSSKHYFELGMASLDSTISSYKNTLRKYLCEDKIAVLLLYNQNAPRKSLIHIDESILLSASLNEDSLTCVSLKYKGVAYQKLNNFDSAKLAIDTGISIANKNKNYRNLSDFYITLGNTEFQVNHDMNMALQNFDSSIACSEIIDDSLNLAKAKLNKGICLYRLGSYKESLKYYLESIELSILLKDSSNILRNNLAIANIYVYRLKSYEEALEYFDKCIEQATSQKNDYILFASLLSSAETLLKLDRITESIENLKLAKKVYSSSTLGNSTNIYEAHIAMLEGRIDVHNHNYEKAISHYNVASQIFTDNQKLYDLYSAQTEKVQILVDLGKARDAQDILNNIDYESLPLSRKLLYKELYLLTLIYLGPKKEATETFLEFVYLKNQFNEKEQKAAIIKEKAELSFLNEKLIASQKIELLSANSKLQERRFSMLLLIFFIVLTGIGVLVFSIRNINLKRKVEKEKYKSELLNIELANLRNQFNPHFIFNILTSIRQVVSSKNTALAENFIDQFALYLRGTLEYSRFETVTIEQEFETIRLYLELEKINVDNQFTIEMQMGDGTSQLEIPPMLIQPIVENSIKHAFTGKKTDNKIKISATVDHNSTITIDVQDNGIGISPNAGNKVKNSSFGTSIIKKKLRLFDRKYSTESSISHRNTTENTDYKGTTVTIVIHDPA